MFGGLETGMNYTPHTRRIGFGADAGVGLSAYQDEPLFQTYRAAANLNARVTRYGSLTLAEAIVYPRIPSRPVRQPHAQLGTFADPFANLATDYGVFRQNSYRSTTTWPIRRNCVNTRPSQLYLLSTAKYEADELNYVNHWRVCASPTS